MNTQHNMHGAERPRTAIAKVTAHGRSYNEGADHRNRTGRLPTDADVDVAVEDEPACLAGVDAPRRCPTTDEPGP